jgi:uncharacterized membrane protein
VTNIVTDSNWSCTISNGPIQGASIWDGETYAVTNEAKVANWSTIAYTATNIFTNGVTTSSLDGAKLVGQPTDPIQIIEYIRPIDMWTNH